MRRHLLALQSQRVAGAVEPFVVLGNRARDHARVVGELGDQQLADMRMDDELLIALQVERAVGIGLAELRVDVHLAEVMQQAAHHRDAQGLRVAAMRHHHCAVQDHRLHRVVE